MTIRIKVLNWGLKISMQLSILKFTIIGYYIIFELQLNNIIYKKMFFFNK